MSFFKLWAIVALVCGCVIGVIALVAYVSDDSTPDWIKAVFTFVLITLIFTTLIFFEFRKGR